jgi:hypothetical protein
MIRGVGPYSALITPQAGSLFHAVFHFSLISPGRISLPRKGCRVGLHIVLFEIP